MNKLYKEYTDILESWDDIDSDSLDDEEGMPITEPMTSISTDRNIGAGIRNSIMHRRYNFSHFHFDRDFTWNGLRFTHKTFNNYHLEIYICYGASDRILFSIVGDIGNIDAAQTVKVFIPTGDIDVDTQVVYIIIRNAMNTIHNRIMAKEE